jgi:hypothetical protein
MRNHIRALTLLTAFAGVMACSDDFLSEVPSDFVAPENFYRNQGDAISAVTAAYATFINLPSPLGVADYLGRNLSMLIEYPTEITTSRLSATNERSLIGTYHTQRDTQYRLRTHLVLRFATESKLILWLSVGNFVNAKPFVGGADKAGEVALDVLNV